MARKQRQASEVLTALDAAETNLDVSTLAAEMIAEFGGTRAFAREYVQELRGCRGGGMAKSKMLDGVLRLVTTAGARDKGKDEEDLSGVPDDQIRAYLQRLLVEPVNDDVPTTTAGPHGTAERTEPPAP